MYINENPFLQTKFFALHTNKMSQRLKVDKMRDILERVSSFVLLLFYFPLSYAWEGDV